MCVFLHHKKFNPEGTEVLVYVKTIRLEKNPTKSKVILNSAGKSIDFCRGKLRLNFPRIAIK